MGLSFTIAAGPRQRSHSRVRVPRDLITIFYCLRFVTPPTWRASPRIYIPQEQGDPVIPPGSGFPFRRLLRLARLRWRYSNPSPYGVTDWVAPLVFLITSLHGPSRKHLSNSNSVVVEACLLRRCLEVGCRNTFVYSPVA
jgi:hypothetical protein